MPEMDCNRFRQFTMPGTTQGIFGPESTELLGRVVDAAFYQTPLRAEDVPRVEGIRAYFDHQKTCAGCRAWEAAQDHHLVAEQQHDPEPASD